MKLPVRIILALLCAAMVLAMPFVLSSPTMLGDAVQQIRDQTEDEDEIDLFSWLLPHACAEDTQPQTAVEYELPIDLTAGMKPNPACFTEAGYEDDSIRVQMETREEDGVIWRIAWVEVASPTQLRTGVAGTVNKPKNRLVKTIAAECNAVVALNGDWFSNDPDKTTFEYRMGQKIRSKTNRYKDILIIDENGDFHIIMAAEPDIQKAAIQAVAKEHQIVNAFTFGPALVDGGEVLNLKKGHAYQLGRKDYGYNSQGKEPRSAIGQLDTLSYVFVIAEGRGDSEGVTHQELADFMGTLGCRAAFNLDGGGTATLVFNGEVYNKIGGDPRQQSDIIYFATAVPPETWE